MQERPASRESTLSQRARLTESASDLPVPSQDVTLSEGGTAGGKHFAGQERAREGENVEYYSFSKERYTDTEADISSNRKVDEGDVSITVNSSVDNTVRIDSFYEDDGPQPEEVQPVAPAATTLERRSSSRDEPESAREDRSAASTKSRSRHDHDEKSQASTASRKRSEGGQEHLSKSNSHRSSLTSVADDDHSRSEKHDSSSRIDSKCQSKSSSRHGRRRSKDSQRSTHRSKSRENSERHRSQSRSSRKSSRRSASGDHSERFDSPHSHRSDSTLAGAHSYSSDFTESEGGGKSTAQENKKRSSRPTSERSYQSQDMSQRSLHDESREQPTGGSQASLDKICSERIQEARRDDDDESRRSRSNYTVDVASVRSDTSATGNRELSRRSSRSSVQSQQDIATGRDEYQASHGHAVGDVIVDGDSIRSSTPRASSMRVQAEADISHATIDCSTCDKPHVESLKHERSTKSPCEEKDEVTVTKSVSRTSSAGSSKSRTRPPVPSLNLEDKGRKKRKVNLNGRGEDFNPRDDGRGFHPYEGVPPPKPERRGSVSELNSPDSSHQESRRSSVKYSVSSDPRGPANEPIDPANLKEYYVTEDEATTLTDRSFRSEKSHASCTHSVASGRSSSVYSHVSASGRGNESKRKDKRYSASSGRRTPDQQPRFDYSSDDFYHDSKSDISQEVLEDPVPQQSSRRSSVASDRSRQSVESALSRGSRKDKGGISSAEAATKRGRDAENHQDSFHSDFSDEWKDCTQNDEPDAVEQVSSTDVTQPTTTGNDILDKSEGFIPDAAPGSTTFQAVSELSSTERTASQSESARSHVSHQEEATEKAPSTSGAELGRNDTPIDRPASRTDSLRSRDDLRERPGSRAASASSRTSTQHVQPTETKSGSQPPSRTGTPDGDAASQRSRSGSIASKISTHEDNLPDSAPSSRPVSEMRTAGKPPRVGSAASRRSIYDTYPPQSSPASYPASLADSPKNQGTPDRASRVGSAASRGSHQGVLRQGSMSPSGISGRLDFADAHDSETKPIRAPSQSSMYDVYPAENTPASWPASLAGSPQSESSRKKAPRVGSAASRGSLYDSYPPENAPASYPASLDNVPITAGPPEKVSRPGSVASRTSMYDAYPAESSPASWPASLAGSPKNEKKSQKATRKESTASRGSTYDTYPPESSPASWPASLAGSPKVLSPRSRHRPLESRVSRDSVFDAYPPESSPASRPSSRVDSPIIQVIERDVGITRIGSAGSFSGLGEVKQPASGEAIVLSRPGSALSQSIQSPRDSLAQVECIVDVGIDRQGDAFKAGSRRSSHHSRVSSLGDDIGPLAQSTARTESKPSNRPASALSRGSARDSPRIAADVDTRRESVFSRSESEISDLPTFRAGIASTEIPETSENRNGIDNVDQNVEDISNYQQCRDPVVQREEVSKSMDDPKHSESAYYSRPSSDSSDMKPDAADFPTSSRREDVSIKQDLDQKSAEPSVSTKGKTSRPPSSSSVASNKSASSKQAEGAVSDVKATESRKSSRRGSKGSITSEKGDLSITATVQATEESLPVPLTAVPIESTYPPEDNVQTRRDSVASVGSTKSDAPSMVIAFPGEKEHPPSRASPAPSRKSSVSSETAAKGASPKKSSRHGSTSSQKSTTEATAEKHSRRDSVSSQKSLSEASVRNIDQQSDKKMENGGRRSRRSSNTSSRSVEATPIETLTYCPTEPLRAEPQSGPERGNEVVVHPDGPCLSKPPSRPSSAEIQKKTESSPKMSSRPSSGQKDLEIIAGEAAVTPEIEASAISSVPVEVSPSVERRSSGGSLKVSTQEDSVPCSGEVPGSEYPASAESPTVATEPSSRPPSAETQPTLVLTKLENASPEAQTEGTEADDESKLPTVASSAVLTTAQVETVASADIAGNVALPPSYPASTDQANEKESPMHVELPADLEQQAMNSVTAEAKAGSRRSSSASQASVKAIESSMKEMQDDPEKTDEGVSPKPPSPAENMSDLKDVAADAAHDPSGSASEGQTVDCKEEEPVTNDITDAPSEMVTEEHPPSPEVSKSSLKEDASGKTEDRQEADAPSTIVQESAIHPSTPTELQKSPSGSVASVREADPEKAPSRRGSSASCSSVKASSQTTKEDTSAPEPNQTGARASSPSPSGSKTSLRECEKSASRQGSATSLKNEIGVTSTVEDQSSVTKEVSEQTTNHSRVGSASSQSSMKASQPLKATTEKPPSRKGSSASISAAPERSPGRSESLEKVDSGSIKETRISSAGSNRSLSVGEDVAGGQSSTNAATKPVESDVESTTPNRPSRPAAESHQEPDSSKLAICQESDVSQMSGEAEKGDVIPQNTDDIADTNESKPEVDLEEAKPYEPLPEPAVYISKRESIILEDSESGRKTSVQKSSSRSASVTSESPLRLPDNFSDIPSCMVFVGEIEKVNEEKREKPPSRPGSSASLSSTPSPQTPAPQSAPPDACVQSPVPQPSPRESPVHKPPSRPSSVSSHSSRQKSDGIIVVTEKKPEPLGQARISSAGSVRSLSSHTSAAHDLKSASAMEGVENGTNRGQVDRISSAGSTSSHRNESQKLLRRQGSAGSTTMGSSPPSPAAASPRIINVAESPRNRSFSETGVNGESIGAGKPPSGRIPKGERRLGSDGSRTSLEGTSENPANILARPPSGGSRSSQQEPGETVTKQSSRPGSGASQASTKMSPKSEERRTSETSKISKRRDSNTSQRSDKALESAVDDTPPGVIVVAESPKGSRHSSFGSRSSLREETKKTEERRLSNGSLPSANAAPAVQILSGSLETSLPQPDGTDASAEERPAEDLKDVIVVGEAQVVATAGSRPSSAASQTSAREQKGSNPSSRRGSRASQASLKIVQQVNKSEGLTVVGDVVIEASDLITRSRSGSRPPSAGSTSSLTRMKPPPENTVAVEVVGNVVSAEKPPSRKGSLQGSVKGSDLDSGRPPLTRSDALPALDSDPSVAASATVTTPASADAASSTDNGVVIDFQSSQDKDLSEKEVEISESSVKKSSRPSSGSSIKDSKHKSSRQGSVSSQKSLNETTRKSPAVPTSPSAPTLASAESSGQKKSSEKDSMSPSEAMRSPSMSSEIPGTGVYCPHPSRTGSVVEPSLMIVDLNKVAEKLSQQGSLPGSRSHSRQNSASSHKSGSSPHSPPSVFEPLPKAAVYVAPWESASPKEKSPPASPVISSPVFEPLPKAAEHISTDRSAPSPKAGSPPSSPVSVDPQLSTPQKKKESSPTGSVSSAQSASRVAMANSEAPVPPEVEADADLEGLPGKRSSVYSRGAASETSSARGLDIDTAVPDSQAEADATAAVPGGPLQFKTLPYVSASFSVSVDSSQSEMSALVHVQDDNSTSELLSEV